ncbi:MAG: hypothetical protein M3Q75_14270 [Gemmatimonadota bacterium]|nr:hypothetical protein [Gemmatimonadota bacterium]
MPDRPAAELLAEFDAVSPRWQEDTLTVSQHRDILCRLIVAEQALAEAQAEAWYEGWTAGVRGGLDPALSHNPYRAALRASQEADRA